jgi:hypothetical protein
MTHVPSPDPARRQVLGHIAIRARLFEKAVDGMAVIAEYAGLTAAPLTDSTRG